MHYCFLPSCCLWIMVVFAWLGWNSFLCSSVSADLFCLHFCGFDRVSYYFLFFPSFLFSIIVIDFDGYWVWYFLFCGCYDLWWMSLFCRLTHVGCLNRELGWWWTFCPCDHVISNEFFFLYYNWLVSSFLRMYIDK